MLGQEQLFYELYIFDQRTSQSLPVPVRIVNQLVDPKKRGQTTTTTTGTGTGTGTGTTAQTTSVTNIYAYFLCDAGDNVVRRFFLTDIISGMSTTSTNGNPQVMRYASYMMLETALSPTAFGKIFAPVLTIYYNETDVDPIIQGKYSSITNVSFDTSYTMSVGLFRATLITFFIIYMIIVGCYFIFS